MLLCIIAHDQHANALLISVMNGGGGGGGGVCVHNKQVWRHDEVGEAVQYRLLQSDSNLWELKRRNGWIVAGKVSVGCRLYVFFPSCNLFIWVIGLAAVGGVFLFSFLRSFLIQLQWCCFRWACSF